MLSMDQMDIIDEFIESFLGINKKRMRNSGPICVKSFYRFSLTTDIGSLEYRAHYMVAQGRHMRGFEFYSAWLAEVK